jgi:uncharacterized peroxidase-related enzyme
MTWIKTIPPSEAGELLRNALDAQKILYPTEYAATDAAAEIVMSHSLIPAALHHAFATFGVLMSPALPLSRRHHEMIATMVSLTNRCRYWIDAHAEFLRRVTLDEKLVTALREDYLTAPISDQERALLDYVVKLSKDATQISPEDHGRLRGAGFDDTAILQITLIASWFNYINRVADALGVGRTATAGAWWVVSINVSSFFSWRMPGPRWKWGVGAGLLVVVSPMAGSGCHLDCGGLLPPACSH